MISFIYFDIGGVLIDWSDVFESAAQKFDLDPEDMGKIFDENHDPVTLGELSADELWEKCIQRYGLENASEYDFLGSWVSDYKPILETHDLIYNIKSDFKIGLLSNIYKGMLPLLLEKHLIPNIDYEQIIFSCDVGMMKPNADIYDLARTKSGAPPEEILLVDDRNDYCEGAERAGWQNFLFDSKERDRSVNELREFLARSK